MEPNKSIDQTFSALGNISADELDDLLQLDMIPPTQDTECSNELYSISQFDMQDTTQNLSNVEKNSVIIAENEIELVHVNDATEVFTPIQTQNQLETSISQQFTEFEDDIEITLSDEKYLSESNSQTSTRHTNECSTSNKSSQISLNCQYKKMHHQDLDQETQSSTSASAFSTSNNTTQTTHSSGQRRNMKNDSSNLCENINRQLDNVAIDMNAIPLSVHKLYRLMKSHYCDFSFVYALSAQLCQDRVPMNCFVNVKMALVLSIASCGKNMKIAPIPIVVLVQDSYMANHLMMSIADLAERFVGPMEDAKASSSDGYKNHVWIEADPIQLAKGGVFYAGDWSCLKKARSENILKIIETSRIPIERTTRLNPLETAIWTTWRAFKYNAKDQQLFNKFSKIFGIPIYMDDDNHEALTDLVLQLASVEFFESSVDSLTISTSDMRQFFAVISERTVDVTPDAISLLQKYFVASRIERPDCLTKQSFVTLKQFAESFARLSLRHEVLTIDAVGAIYMCENFVRRIYGAGSDPPPTMGANNFVGNVEIFIAQFHEWLQKYVSKYTDEQK